MKNYFLAVTLLTISAPALGIWQTGKYFLPAARRYMSHHVDNKRYIEQLKSQKKGVDYFGLAREYSRISAKYEEASQAACRLAGIRNMSSYYQGPKGREVSLKIRQDNLKEYKQCLEIIAQVEKIKRS